MARRSAYAHNVYFAAGPPSKWLVTLVNGSVVEVWADGYSEVEGTLVFSILVDATTDEQQVLEVTGPSPSRPERVIITVARFPMVTVQGPPTDA